MPDTIFLEVLRLLFWILGDDFGSLGTSWQGKGAAEEQFGFRSRSFRDLRCISGPMFDAVCSTLGQNRCLCVVLVSRQFFKRFCGLILVVWGLGLKNKHLVRERVHQITFTDAWIRLFP